MKKKLLVGFFVSLFIFGIVSVVSATTLDFEDLGSGNLPLPTNYSGLTWDSGVPDNQGNNNGAWWSDDSGYTQVHSGTHSLYNAYGPPTLGFDFASGMNSVGAWFATAGANMPYPLQMVGYVGSTATYFSGTLTPTNTPQYLSISSSLNDITRVEINQITIASWYSMDDLYFTSELTSVPEPATMFLLGTGLVGVAGAARRRKKNQA